MDVRPAPDSLILRAATLNDGGEILQWRNDEVTRAMSRNTAPVSTAEHMQWFKCTLNNPAKLLLVGWAGTDRIGMARFDRLADDAWEVNINLAPAHRGKGWSHALLGGALKALTVHRPSEIIAEIKPENFPSRRVFEAHGFRRVGSFAGIERFVLSCRG